MNRSWTRSLVLIVAACVAYDAEAGPRGGGGGGGRKGGGGGRQGGGQAAATTQEDWADACGYAVSGLKEAEYPMPGEAREYTSSNGDDKILKLRDDSGVKRYFEIVAAAEADDGVRTACGKTWDEMEAAYAVLAMKSDWVAEAMPTLIQYGDQHMGNGDVAKAIDELNVAVDMATVALWVHPASTVLPQAKASAEAKLATYKASYAKTLSGAYHADHVGQLWFSTAPVALGQENVAALSQKADPSQGLYAAAYYAGPLASMGGNPGGEVRAEVNFWKDAEGSGQADEDYHWTIDAKGATATALALEIWPSDPAKAQVPGLAVKYAEFIRGLGPGTHTVQIQMAMTDPRDGGKTSGPYAMPFAKVSVTVPSDLSAFEASATKIYNTWVDGQRMPKAKKSDSSLSSQLMKAYTEAGWNEKPLRAVIVESDWTYFYDDWNRPIQRTIRAAVAVDSGDGTCRVFDGIYQADSPDYKKWDAPYLNLITGDFPIACGNVSK